jgi:hypothetical protein
MPTLVIMRSSDTPGLTSTPEQWFFDGDPQ